MIHAFGQTSLSCFSGSSIGRGRRSGSCLFLRARRILVDKAFLFRAIDRLKGAAAAGPVQGLILGPARVPAVEITVKNPPLPRRTFRLFHAIFGHFPESPLLLALVCS